ncbi:MAG: FKBP-type peptidyl-prolyl cis-trans isomerase, partial [Verrucomicrobiota bacterium]
GFLAFSLIHCAWLQAQEQSASGEETLAFFREWGYASAPAGVALQMTDAEKLAFLEGVRARLTGRAAYLPADGSGMAWPLSAFYRKLIDGYWQQMLPRMIATNRLQELHFFEVLDQNDSVTATDSGLRYQLHLPGSGPTVQPGDNVRLRFTTKLVNGDIVEQPEEPQVMPVDGVIAGLAEGLQVMKAGSTATLYVPAKLAYGDTIVTESRIPPAATAIFEIELLEINPPLYWFDLE